MTVFSHLAFPFVRLIGTQFIKADVKAIKGKIM